MSLEKQLVFLCGFIKLSNSWVNFLYSGLDCVCGHELVEAILNKEILRIQLLTLWDSTRSNTEITPK